MKLSSVLPPRVSAGFLKGSWIAWLLAAWLATTLSPAPILMAQEEEPPPDVEKTPPKPKPKRKQVPEGELLEPEAVMLTTEDGVKLALTYFPGTKGKESIPVVCLHPYKGSQKDFTEGLAPYLQRELGCAVVVPDLRGHGGSKTPKLDAASMGARNFFPLMISQDVRAVKDFLWKKNNDGELNINKTCVVGVEMGALVAMDYAVYDSMGYEQRTPVYGPLKLGRFVKAMVLISPEQSFKTFGLENIRKADASVRTKMPVMILVGAKHTKGVTDAKRIHDSLFKPGRGAETDKKSKTLLLGRLDTSLAGAKLLAPDAKLGVEDFVKDFIQARVVDASESKSWGWKSLKLPHE